MRHAPKVYRDENYRDPIPAAACPLCGEPVYPGDPCYEIQGGLICRDCIKKYILEDYGAEELAQALKLEEKRWA